MSLRPEEPRPPTLAGSWYEGNPTALRKRIAAYLDQAPPASLPGIIKGIIVPHAGHVYSGPVAGYAYRLIRGMSFDVVVIVAPNHVDPTLDFTSVMTRGAYATPLGDVPVDEETARAIVDFPCTDTIRESNLGHRIASGGRMEHAVEIQLPFLQVALGSCRIVPIVMGNRDRGTHASAALGQAIAGAVKGKKALIVASTDLSHFHDLATLLRLDNAARERIDAFDPEGLLTDMEKGHAEACGGLPTAAVMIACRELGATTARVLHMANSGDVSGDYSGAVGYLAAVITAPDTAVEGSDNSEEKHPAIGVDLGLSEHDREVLREVVRATLASVVNGGPVKPGADRSGKLGEPWGAFVTLTKGGDLRGCIGHIVGDKPLAETVAEMARAAALEDPRFNAVQARELPSLDFEISVLTPIKPLESVESIVIGRDGLIITRGWNRGLLLPQVASEYGWDRTTFLEQTCVKAGLPRDAWKDSRTKIEVFSAEVF